MGLQIAQATATPRGPLIHAPALSMGKRIDLRRGIVLRQEFEILGRLCAIVFEPEGMNPARPRAEVFCPNTLQWEDNNYRCEENGPWLGLSLDHQDLLMISDVPHPPAIPDTTTPYVWDEEKKERVPILRAQHYHDRTQTLYRHRNGDRTTSKFLVIQPVKQFIYRPARGRQFALAGTWRQVRAETGFDGTKFTFLIDPKTREGHFLGGRFIIGAAH